MLLDDLGANTLGTGFVNEARRACNDCAKMHFQHARDSPDYINKALKLGHYEQAMDMIDFDTQRMASSYQLAVCRAELALLGLLEHSASAQQLETYLQQSCGTAGTAGGGGGGGSNADSRVLPMSQAEIEALSLNHDYGPGSSWDCPADPLAAWVSARAGDVARNSALRRPGAVQLERGATSTERRGPRQRHGGPGARASALHL